MKTLQECIDEELEAAGFAKSAARTPPNKDPAFGKSRQDASAAPVNIPSVGDEVPVSQRGASRATQSEIKPVVSSASGLNQLKAASPYDLVGRYRRLMRDKVASACGLSGSYEVHKVFSSSDTLNILKLAGIMDRVMNMVPAEPAAYLTGAARGVLGGYTPQGVSDAERFFIGRAMQEAGAAVDANKARRIFESLGGHPAISYEDLADLAMRAGEYDKMRKAAPYSNVAAAAAGAGLGGLGGLAAGYYAHKDRERQRPTFLLTGGRVGG